MELSYLFTISGACDIQTFNLMNMFSFRLIDRVRKTVRGSADDIGWLQRDPTMPSVEDGTERFMEILGDIRYSFMFYCA